jgi:hypothetical protein
MPLLSSEKRKLDAASIISKNRLAMASPGSNGNGHHGSLKPAKRAALLELAGKPSVFDSWPEDKKKELDEAVREHCQAKGGTPMEEEVWMKDLRALSIAVSALGHHTPEQKAFLESIGLHDDAIAPRYCQALAGGVLQVRDDYQQDSPHPRSGTCGRRSSLLWGGGRDEHPSKVGVNTVRLSEVEALPVGWLWHQRVPMGMLTLLNGDPELGKTWLSLDMAARITTGRGFPDGAANPFGERRDVLWVSAEDPDGQVVKPRLQMLEADVTRVHSFKFVLEKSLEGNYLTEHGLDLSCHIEQLDQWLDRNKLVAMMILDPLAAFIGRTDSHRNSEVRRLLSPLSKLAAKHDVAIIGINHLSKGNGENAMYRGMGSIAFVAAARSSWLIAKDKKRPKDRRLFTKIKCNVQTEDVGGLSFLVGPQVPQGISWEKGRLDITADETLRIADGRAPAKAEAKEWLLELLKDGPVPSDDVWSKAEADGLNSATLKSAKKELSVRSRKMGGSGQGWAWELPSKKP